LDLNYSEAQLLFQDSVSRFIANEYRPPPIETSPCCRIAVTAAWRRFAELGWLGVPFSSEFGGFDGSIVDVAIVMEQFGHGLVREPYLSAILLGGAVVAQAAPQKQKAALLPKIISGEVICALAYNEPEARGVTATWSGDCWHLSGTVALVLDAQFASHIIVAARTFPGGEEPMLFLVGRDAAGMIVNNRTLISGASGAQILLTETAVSSDAMLGGGDDTAEIVKSCIDRATIALGFEALGCAEAMLAATIEYVKMRRQFGQSLVEFQVVRHRIADMIVACEEARSIALYAALLHSADPRETGAAAAMVKAKALTSLRQVAEDAIQLHGAIGLTSELKLGSYFTRIMFLESLFGTPDDHLDQYVGLRGLKEHDHSAFIYR